MSARIGVVVMAVLLAVYIGLVGHRAVLLVLSGDPVGIAMGVALIVLPLVAVWALGRELWFGVRAQQLAGRLEADGALPDDEVEVRPSGRVIRADGRGRLPALPCRCRGEPRGLARVVPPGARVRRGW